MRRNVKTELMYGIDWGTEDLGRLADDDASSASGNGDGELAELLLAGLTLTPSNFRKPADHLVATSPCMYTGYQIVFSVCFSSCP